MAGCDYYTCDACGGKSFYDVELGWGGFGSTPPLNRPGLDGLPGCGDIRALCKDCAKTHRIIVVTKSAEDRINAASEAMGET